MITPKVTVLLCVYAGADRVGAAIRSILAQTFTDFELLVIDDASPDTTAAVVRSFADPRIRLLQNEQNLGTVPSANRGLREARGTYIARIDHDDLCAPTRLEREVAILDAEPGVGAVGTWMRLVDRDDRPLGFVRGRIDSRAHFLFLTLIDMIPIGNSSSMFRREAALGIGGYDETMGPAEDKDLWRRLALSGWDARVVREPLTVYRMHPGQLSEIRADLQRANDSRSLYAAVAQLAPLSDPVAVRSLLAWNDAFWSECTAVADARRLARKTERVITELVDGATDLVGLSTEEARRLKELLLAHIVRQARRSWRQGIRSHWRTASLARVGLSAPRASTVWIIVTYLLALPFAPALVGMRRAKRMALALLAHGTDASPRLAALYARLHNDPWTHRD